MSLFKHAFRPAMESITPDEISTEEWIGFDIDGTTAHYDGWKGIEHIGEPIPEVITLIKQFLHEGKTVKFFTSRVATDNEVEREQIKNVINRYALQHIGQTLPITCVKDRFMTALYDDRAIQVVTNQGIIIKGES